MTDAETSPPLQKRSDRSLADVIDDVMAAQKDFEARRASVLGRGAEKITEPLGRAAAALVPSSVVRRALELADAAAGATLFGTITRSDDLEASEQRALGVQAWAVGTNAASGGAAGWFGGAGMTIDIPATILMGARNVRATGAAYGFDRADEAERAFRLAILELASVAALDKRQSSLARINRIAGVLSGGKVDPLRDTAEWVVQKTVERVSRELGAAMLRRKAAQIVPLAGALIAASVNASFQTDVSRAARYAYRQRWLMTRRYLEPPEA